jgi:hypothetical protein
MITPPLPFSADQLIVHFLQSLSTLALTLKVSQVYPRFDVFGCCSERVWSKKLKICVVSLSMGILHAK